MIESDTRQANWRRANLKKYEAHLAVHNAVKTGELEKQACEVCGVASVDAHHDQYEHPLQVRWLCRRHHTRLHHFGEDMFPINIQPLPNERTLSLHAMQDALKQFEPPSAVQAENNFR